MQKIDYDSLIKNAKYFKGLIGNAKLCAVVKNDAYGHGIERAARYLSSVVDYFAVGSVQETEEIYKLGKDVLILLPQDTNDAMLALRRNCILTVDSFCTLSAVIDAALSCKRTARVHIKIDSGMSRLGFCEEELNELVLRLKECSQIDVQGVYSHFWGDTEQDCDRQFEKFDRCYKFLEKSLNKPLVKHIANTTGTLLSPKYHLDMVRVGLGLYGYGDPRLYVAKTVTARIVAVKTVRAGEVVGYGGKYECGKDTKIAVLDVGYAQGLPRTLVGSCVKIGGAYCKIAAVCMAMTMIELPDDLSAHAGDFATLVGAGVNMSNGNVIVYELLCNLH